MQITSKQGQWLGDIVVSEAGTIESIFEMAVVNNISITENMQAGVMLEKPTAVDKRVLNYYRTNNIFPATTTNEPKTLGGIGYMAIGIDFIVS